jgi:hypothetical protein
MKIQWRTYIITVNDYSWDLHERRMHKSGKNTGKSYIVDLGFFTKLNTLLDKIMKIEHSRDKDTIELEQLIARWEDVVSGFIKRIDE